MTESSTWSLNKTGQRFQRWRSKIWTDGRRTDDGRGLITIAHPEPNVEIKYLCLMSKEIELQLIYYRYLLLENREWTWKNNMLFGFLCIFKTFLQEKGRNDSPTCYQYVTKVIKKQTELALNFKLLVFSNKINCKLQQYLYFFKYKV